MPHTWLNVKPENRSDQAFENIFPFYLAWILPLIIFYFLTVLLVPSKIGEDVREFKTLFANNRMWLYGLAFIMILSMIIGDIWYPPESQKRLALQMIRVLGVFLA